MLPTELAETSLDRSITRAVRRLVPFLLLMYVVSFLDRANISFAKTALQVSAGISESAYALGAGLFFLTYAAFGVPSNLIMHRIGARVWMCCMMVSWGLVSMATTFVAGQSSFYVLRLLLGVTEAGFFPGVILYLTYWFPNRTRGRVLGLFYFGAPLAFIFGGPLSGGLMEMPETVGLHGWQWMFLIEGFLAIVVGISAYWYLGNKPEDAAWLPAPEKAALIAQLAREENDRHAQGPSALWGAFRDFRVLHFALVYFLLQASVYGVVFYLPTDIAAILGTSVGAKVGFVSAVPWICALVGTFWLPRVADRYDNHHLLAALVLAASGLVSIASPRIGPMMAFLSICFAASGFIAVQPLFWTFPTRYLAGSAAAGGIAIINGLGALGGFVAPNLKVWADRRFASATAGFYFLAVLTLVNAVLIAGIGRQKMPLRSASSKSTP